MEEIGREKIYHGRAFDVYQVRLRMPDDDIKTYDLVQHNRAVVILPQDETGCLIFVKQYRVGAAGTLLELPAGVLEKDEEPETCARREIREETGMAAKQWEKLGEMYIAPGYCTEYQYVYLASNLQAAPLEADSDEFIEIVRIPIVKVYEMVEAGRINDGKTLAALMLARKRLLESGE